MAIVEETIGSGQDRATVALWESNVSAFGTDIFKGIISTNDEFAEVVTLNGSGGTPSSTSYLWLTVDPANGHVGVAGTGHGRMAGAGTGTLSIVAAFTRVDWLEIKGTGTGTSHEGIRVQAGADDVLIDYCIVWSANTAQAQRDGIYTGNYSVANLRISNCMIYGWTRAGINLQNHTGANTQTIDIDHCSIYECGHDDALESGALRLVSTSASAFMTLGIFNTWGDMAAVSASKEAFSDGETSTRTTPAGTSTWNGSHNLATEFGVNDEIDGTNNTTDWQYATTSPFTEETTQSSGSYVVITEKGVALIDMTLLDDAAGNLAAGNGINRQGSEPDTRQDFSTAIDGPRPTDVVDIGASQVSVGAVSTVNLFVRKSRRHVSRLG